MQWFEAVGFFGLLVGLSAYACVQLKRDFSKTYTFSVMNLVSAILVGVTFCYQWNTVAFAGNVVWGLISLYGLYRCNKYKWRTDTRSEIIYREF